MNVPTYRARSMKFVKEEKKNKRRLSFVLEKLSLRDCVKNQKRQRESLDFVLICI